MFVLLAAFCLVYPQSSDFAEVPRPLTLEETLQLAVLHAPELQQARFATQSASAAWMQAGGLFDPVLFGDLTYSILEQPTSGGIFSGSLDAQHIRSWTASQGIRRTLTTGGVFEVSLSETYREDNLPQGFFGFNPESNVGLNFSLTQPLLRGAWRMSTTQPLEDARLNQEGTQALEGQALLNVIQASADAYWGLAFALDDLEVKELSLRLAQELRTLTVAKYEAGTAAEVEVVQTDADVAARTEVVLTARNAVATAQDALKVLLFPLANRRDWETDVVPTSSPPVVEKGDLRWPVAVQEALAKRPDLAQLRSQVQRAKLALDVARRNLLPSLDLIASGSSAGVARQIPDAFEFTRGFYYTGYSVGVSVEIPVGNRESRGAELVARRNWELANRQLRDQERAVANEVREAVRNLHYLVQRVSATEIASQAARRQLEAEQRRLAEGASTNFQVLQFQEDLAEALSGEKNARMEFAKAWMRTKTVRGLTPPQDD